MDSCSDSVQTCVAELLIRNFEAACAKATPSTKGGVKLGEVCSGPLISANGFLFGLVVCWQVQDDGSPDLSSDLGVALRRLDAEAQCAVVCLREVRILNQNAENSRCIEDTDTEDVLPGVDVGWVPHSWGSIEDFPLKQLLNPSLGWLHDGHLRVECRLLCRGAFIVGDTVRAHYNKEDSSDERVKSSDTGKGKVTSIDGAEVTVDFDGSRAQAVPREWVVAFASGSDVPQPAPAMTKDPVREDLRGLLASEAFADATIEVLRADGAADELPVHAAILWARSEVFKRMLSSQMREGKEKRVVITHLEVSAVRATVAFIYSGEVAESMLADADSAMALLVAAHFFDERALVAKCAAAVGLRLDASSVCECLLLARQYDCTELMLDCLSFLRRHILDVHGTEAFRKVLETCPAFSPQTDPRSSPEGCLPARGSCAGSKDLCRQAAQHHNNAAGTLRLMEAPMERPSRFGFDLRMCEELEVVSAYPSSQAVRQDSERSVEILGRCRPQLMMVPLPGQLEFGANVFYIGSHKDLHDGSVLSFRQAGRVSGPGISKDTVDVLFEGHANLFNISHQEISSEDPGIPGGLQVNDTVFLIGNPRCDEDLDLGAAGLVIGAHSSTQVAVLFDGCEEAVYIHHEMLTRDSSVLPGGWRIDDEVFFTGRAMKYGHGLRGRIVGPAGGHRSFTHVEVQFDLDQDKVLVKIEALSREKPQLPGGWRTHDIVFKRGERGQLGKVFSAVSVATDTVFFSVWGVCDRQLRDDASSLLVLFAGDSAPISVPIETLTQECTLSELLRCVSQNYSSLQQSSEFAAFVDRFLKDAPLWAQVSRPPSAKPLWAHVPPSAQRGAYQCQARRW